MGNAIVSEESYSHCDLVEEEELSLEGDELSMSHQVGVYGFLRAVLE